MKLPQFAAAAAAVSFAMAAIANEAQTQSQTQSQDAQQQPSSSYSQQAAAGASQQHDAEKVRKLQQELSDKGHNVSVDGIWGPETERALKEFQQAQGMEATGELNQQTLSALGVDDTETAAGQAGSAATGGTASDAGSSAGDTSTESRSN